MDTSIYGLLATDQCTNNLTGVSAHFFLTLINALISTRCAYQPKLKYPPDYGPQIKDNDEFDFIIIGSGSAGSVVANKLSENKKWKILVLEAGGYPSSTSEIPALLYSLQGTDEDWQYTTEPPPASGHQQYCLGLKDRKCRWPRGKGLGGSGMINAMLYLRGNKRDYDQWADQGNRNWNYDSVLEHFQANENIQTPELLTGDSNYGRDGYLTLSAYQSNNPLKKIIEQSAKELGYPAGIVEENDGLGFFESVGTTERGSRANPAASFLGKISKDRRNLFVATNAFVEQLIEVAPKSFRGVSVQIGNNPHKVKLFAKHEVIVSAGSINTPQLLMLSGIGPKEHLDAKGIEVVQDLQVGKNLQDHIVEFGFMLKLIKWPNHLNPQPHQIVDELYQYFMYQRGIFSQIGITNLMGFINTKNDSQIYPNIQYHHVIHTQNDEYLLPQILKVGGIADETAKIQIDTNKNYTTLYMAPTLLNPKSRGEILLNSKDPREKPLIYPNYLNASDDLETLLEGIRFLERLIETKPFADYQPEIVDLKLANCTQYEFRSDDYWRCNLRHLSMTIYHPVGTCKMGPETDRNAVVDDRLRVYGIKNLRVVDASIMPTIISANTQAAAMMIGQKAGAMILEEHQQTEHNEL